MMEVSRGAQELAHLGVRGGGCDFRDALQAFSAQFHSGRGHFVPQVANLRPEEGAFGRLQLQAMLHESF